MMERKCAHQVRLSFLHRFDLIGQKQTITTLQTTADLTKQERSRCHAPRQFPDSDRGSCTHNEGLYSASCRISLDSQVEQVPNVGRRAALDGERLS